MRRRFFTRILLGVTVAVTASLCTNVSGQEGTGSSSGKDSLVPQEQQLGPFEIDLARARALSQTRSSVAAAIPIYRNLLALRPDAGEVAIELAGILMRLGMFRDAIAVLKNAQGPVANQISTNVLIGKCYLWSDQPTEALGVFQRILTTHPNEADSLMYAARAATSTGEHDKAVMFADRFARAVGPSTPRAHFEVAQARFGKSEIVSALTQYRELFHKLTAVKVLTKDELESARRNYGLALSWSGNGKEALPILRDYVARHPEDSTVELELMKAYARDGNTGSTLSMVQAIRSRDKLTPETLLELADAYATIGHYEDVRSIVGSISSDPLKKGRFLVRLTDLMAHWGAFSEGTRMLLTGLEEGLSDPRIVARLGSTLVSDEQPFRARVVYHSLLRSDPNDSGAHCGLAVLESSAGNKVATEKHLEMLSDGRSISPECRFAASGLWASIKRFDKASALLEAGGEPSIPEERRKFFRLHADLARLERRDDEAIRRYREVAKEFPDDAEVAYWVGRYERIEDPVSALLDKSDQYSQRTLLELANSLIDEERPKEALRIVDHLTRHTEDYIPGLMLRAELRGVDGQYEKAIGDYDRLLEKFPDSSKLRLGRARVLAFARRYDEALKEIEILHSGDPDNLEVLREAARYAFWARRFPQALEYYGRLTASIERTPNGAVMSDLLKVVQLERRSKESISARKQDTAAIILTELVALEPGNKEALFDLAQVHCARGLVSASVDCYDRIVNLAPLHRVAPEARAQILRRQHPILQGGGYVRSEEGRGELARITKQQYFAAASLRSGEDWTFGMQANLWREQPHLRRETFESFGPGAEAQYRFGEGMYGRAWIAGRFYSEGSLGSRATGGIEGRFKLNDWNELTAGYERIDEIYNRFGLEDETQSDNLWINLKSTVEKDTELVSQVRILRYSDDNFGGLGFVEGYHALTQMPGRFRLGMRGEFRHTSERNVFTVDSSGVTDIEHPYWAPREYGAGSLFLDWHHELRDVLFCEQNRHFYKIRLAPFSATDGNSGVDLTGEWSLELHDGLGFAVQASIQRSRLYDAEQVSGVLRYNF